MVGTIGEVEPSQLSWSLVRSEAQNWTKSQIVKGLNKEFLKNAKLRGRVKIIHLDVIRIGYRINTAQYSPL